MMKYANSVPQNYIYAILYLAFKIHIKIIKTAKSICFCCHWI